MFSFFLEMGCDLSLFSNGLLRSKSKPTRKRLSSSESSAAKLESESESDYHDFTGISRTESGDGTTTAGRIKQLFSRKRQSDVKAKPTLPSEFCTVVPCSIEESIEQAVRSHNIDQLLKLLRQRGDAFILPSTKVPKKYNPVELACSLGYFDIIEVLLDNGCSPNLPTADGKLIHTVLESLKSHPECIAQGRRVLQNLINKGCDLDIKDRHGITPLLLCAQIGDYNVMNMVLSKCSSKQLHCQCSENQYTPLHMSAMRGDLQCVKLLLSHKPHEHVNLKDSAHNTALHLALKSTRHSLQYLNAARDPLDNTYLTPKQRETQRESSCKHLKIFQQNSVAIVESLVLAGADVNALWGHITSFEYALWLCNIDHTQGFEVELDCQVLSSTLNLVARATIQSLEELGTQEAAAAAMDSKAHFSPYAGIVRLLVLAGCKVPAGKRDKLYDHFENLRPLLDEVFAFWDKYQISRPPRLMHLSKLSIRSYLASIQKLHEINSLPLPPRIKEYVKLNYL